MTTTEHTKGSDRLSLAVENFCQEVGDIFEWNQTQYEGAMAEIERVCAAWRRNHPNYR